jgi:putative transcriptional regulator
MCVFLPRSSLTARCKSRVCRVRWALLVPLLSLCLVGGGSLSFAAAFPMSTAHQGSTRTGDAAPARNATFAVRHGGASGAGSSKDSMLAFRRGQLGLRLDEGLFLVASRSLNDRNFFQTVILLIHTGEDGAVGLVINRPTAHSLASVISELQGSEGESDALFVGGPVLSKVVTMLLRAVEPPEQSALVFEGVYFSSSLRLLRATLAKEGHQRSLRAFAGHAGWTAGQLEREMQQGYWHLVDADLVTLFETDPEAIWPRMIQRASAILALEGQAATASLATREPSMDAAGLPVSAKPRRLRSILPVLVRGLPALSVSVAPLPGQFLAGEP